MRRCVFWYIILDVSKDFIAFIFRAKLKALQPCLLSTAQEWSSKVGKVKCTLVQALRLCTGRTTHRESRGIALPFLDHGLRRWWGVSVTPRPLFTPGKDPVPIVQEAGWAPGPVWTGAENLAPTGIRSRDRPARSQSLYRLRHPAHSEAVPLTFSHFPTLKRSIHVHVRPVDRIAGCPTLSYIS